MIIYLHSQVKVLKVIKFSLILELFKKLFLQTTFSIPGLRNISFKLLSLGVARNISIFKKFLNIILENCGLPEYICK